MALLNVDMLPSLDWRPRSVCRVGAAIVGGAAISAVAGGIASSNQADAAQSAAQTQADAANQASQRQLAEFNQIQQTLAPFVAGGTGAQTQLQQLTGTAPGGNPLTAPLTAPFQPTMTQLASTPGYQFVLNQGLNAVTNSFAAQGLAGSGPLGRGLTQYAEGLAGTTFQQQFNNYLAQNAQINSILQGQVATGENAAAQTGVSGTQNVLAANQFTTSGASASAAGQVAAANALTSGLTNIAGTGSSSALLYALNQQGMFGGTSGGGTALTPNALSTLSSTSPGLSL